MMPPTQGCHAYGGIAANIAKLPDLLKRPLTYKK
jgi:hypothetical protein